MRPSLIFLWLALALVMASVAIAILQIDAKSVILALWGALGLTALIDLLISQTGKSVQSNIDLPKQIFVGETAVFSITFSAGKRLLPTTLNLDFTLDEALKITPLSNTLRISDRSEQTVQLDVNCKMRGNFSIQKMWMKWPSRLRLFDIITVRNLDAEISSVPNIQPVLSGQITAQVQSELFGVKDTDFRGDGSEFHQLSDFSAGMDPRMIDWKRSARRGALVARETRAERNHQIILCVDNGRLMREDIDGLPKIDRAINAALATAWAAGLGGDLVGFFSFDSRPQVYLPPSPGRTAFSQIRAQSTALQYGETESNHTLAMAHLNGKLSRRSLIVVFSDFVDSTTAELLVENMSVLSRHHVLIYVALRDPAVERLMSPESPTIETMAVSVSAAEIVKERKIVLDQLHRMGVVCLDVNPNDVTPELISAYIDIKVREMI